ncbi:hypothetical protein B4U79_01319 [Dinothrombium tinctorium]|uniref:Uncharacterized protein n=1 Tax=Dinothrombium tinctorium TaxID=1965070 RepID=A0A3S3PCS8_9ACAR|nr:hypothetical protein B4U79_01319 [Dinothrombium tinctorium]
MSKNFGIN